MFLGFEEYTALTEGKLPVVRSFKEIKTNDSWKTYSDMKFNLIKHGYDFLGTLFCKMKDVNAFRPTGFDSAFRGGMEEYLEKNNETSLAINLKPNSEYGNDYDKFNDILSEDVIEEVTSCKSRSGDTYYVFINRGMKYFYFLHSDVYSYLLELWMRIRTRGAEEVYFELKSEENIREENRKRREEEERRKSAEQKAIDDEYNRCVELLKMDVEEHPEKYKYVDGHSLPDEFRQAIENGIKTSDYVEYYVLDDSYPNGYYDESQYIVYISDREMTHGYMFKTIVDYGKPGTYYGD